MNIKNKIVIIIGGPTASGKSKLAINLAKEIDGEIINGDSMQVYKNFPILTSQPNFKDKKKIKHHLYGYVSTTGSYNAMDWMQEAKKIINTLHEKNKKPILVGGSGLYLEFLYKGVNNIPNISEKIRNLQRMYSIDCIAAFRMFLKCFESVSSLRKMRDLFV